MKKAGCNAQGKPWELWEIFIDETRMSSFDLNSHKDFIPGTRVKATCEAVDKDGKTYYNLKNLEYAKEEEISAPVIDEKQREIIKEVEDIVKINTDIKLECCKVAVKIANDEAGLLKYAETIYQYITN